MSAGVEAARTFLFLRSEAVMLQERAQQAAPAVRAGRVGAAKADAVRAERLDVQLHRHVAVGAALRELYAQLHRHQREIGRAHV